jgi:hypothetical protein
MNARRVGIFVLRNEVIKTRAGSRGIAGDAVRIAQNHKTNGKTPCLTFGAFKYGVSASFHFTVSGASKQIIYGVVLYLFLKQQYLF